MAVWLCTGSAEYMRNFQGSLFASAWWSACANACAGEAEPVLLDEAQKPVLEVRTVVSETRKLEGDGYDYVERRMLRAASTAALQAAAASSSSVQQVCGLRDETRRRQLHYPASAVQGCLHLPHAAASRMRPRREASACLWD